MYDWVIIGAGICGTAIARRLSKFNLKILIIEKENDVACGATKANSAIIHAGYDAPSDSLRGKLNVRGNQLYEKDCLELSIPFKRIGSLVLALNEKDVKTLDRLYKNGVELGIENLEIIDSKIFHTLEPNVSTKVLAALYAPSAGIIEPWEAAIAYCENAMDNGVEIKFNHKVEKIVSSNSNFVIDDEINCFGIINCAGIHVDEIYELVQNPIEFGIIPRRGQYYLLDKETDGFVNHVLFQCPSKKGKGTLIAPTAHGNIIVGPNAEDLTESEKENTITTGDGLAEVKKNISKIIKHCPIEKNIANFSGIRSESTTRDFIISESSVSRFVNVAGIKSPGLSSAPAIAEYVEKIVEDIHIRENRIFENNENFNPIRRPRVRMKDLSGYEKNEMIKTNPTFGNIVCRCEQISEGEIIDAIERNCGARSLNGVKRRVRPGAGRCQGGFCSPKIVEILAKKLNIDQTKVLWEGNGSYVLTKRREGFDE